jgi:hypothetical protein
MRHLVGKLGTVLITLGTQLRELEQPCEQMAFDGMRRKEHPEEGERHMYYRIAIQVEAQPPWKWQSTALSSLNSLLRWLQVYRAFPQERLRIFSSSSREELNEQLVRENQGLSSSSVPAIQFLQERRIAPQGVGYEASIGETGANERMASVATATSPSPKECSRSPLDQLREELERGVGGDHDLPYRFTLPTSMPQVLAWVKLLARVQQGDFQPEVGACDEWQPQHRHPGGSSTPTYAASGKNWIGCPKASTRSQL